MGELLKEENQTEEIKDQIIHLYSEIFGYYDEALKVVQKEKKEESTEQGKLVYQDILTCLQTLKLNKVNLRNKYLLNYVIRK